MMSLLKMFLGQHSLCAQVLLFKKFSIQSITQFLFISISQLKFLQSPCEISRDHSRWACFFNCTFYKWKWKNEREKKRDLVRCLAETIAEKMVLKKVPHNELPPPPPPSPIINFPRFSAGTSVGGILGEGKKKKGEWKVVCGEEK